MARNEYFNAVDMCDFVLWMGKNAIQYSSDHWKWRGDQYKFQQSTQQMLSHYHDEKKSMPAAKVCEIPLLLGSDICD